MYAELICTPASWMHLGLQVVVESVFEDRTLKKDLFNSMGSLCKQRNVPPDQILLCSNTMSIPMSDITEEVCKEYRGSCIGMRFLHPVWFIDEVSQPQLSSALSLSLPHAFPASTPFHSSTSSTPCPASTPCPSAATG